MTQTMLETLQRLSLSYENMNPEDEMIIIREHINNHTSPLANANYSLASVAFASINHHFPDLESQSFHVNQPDKHCTEFCRSQPGCFGFSLQGNYYCMRTQINPHTPVVHHDVIQPRVIQPRPCHGRVTGALWAARAAH